MILIRKSSPAIAIKSINEVYGHAKGDDVLLVVSSAIRSVVRGRGRGYRWGGGDELVIVLPNHTSDEAEAVAERIRAEVRALRIGGIELPITLSAGIASLPGPVVDADALQAHADAALGQSKASGKDRVQRHAPGLPEAQHVSRENATEEEIQPIIRWLGSHRSEVRMDGAQQLIQLVQQKRVFHSDEVRIGISNLLNDTEEDVRLAGLRVLNALMAHERESVGRRYVRLLEKLAEDDSSLRVRSHVMMTIGSSGDAQYLPRIYAWMNSWGSPEPYDHVDPVGALLGLSAIGRLGPRIRDDLLGLIENAIEPGLSRYTSALTRINQTIR
jgi:diguanylate cyclase (GGDEF)-like protein